MLDSKGLKNDRDIFEINLYKEYTDAKHAKHQVLLNLSNYEQTISIIFLHFQPHFLESEVFKIIIKKCQHVIVTDFIFKESLGLSI